jgi:precorrin-6A/cobalt-precorrin-6A reductase
MVTFSGHATVGKRILLLSGTCEGPPLAEALLAAGFQVRATVTRDEARHNLFGPLRERIDVEVRGFTEETLGDFLRRGEADLVLDATHPFAVRITRIAHAVCTRLGTPYVRYERRDWTPPEGTMVVDSYAAAAEVLPSVGSRIMLTIGAKQLGYFAHLHERLKLYARILPSPVSLQQALAAGFNGQNVLCLRPPFSVDLNRALFREYRLDTLVTKASGPEGGVIEKVTAARDLGMNVLMIRRPPQAGISSVSTLEDAVRACRTLLGGASLGERRGLSPPSSGPRVDHG